MGFRDGGLEPYCKKACLCQITEKNMTTEQKKLTNLQVEMLKLFACDLSDAQLLEIKTS